MDAAQPYLSIELDWRQHGPPDIKAGEVFSNPVQDLRFALIWFDNSKIGKPYTVGQRAQAVRRTIDAFAELRDALVGLDYPTQRKLTDLHDRLSDQSKHGLGEFNTRLRYVDFTQRYWRECRAWIEGLGLLLAEPFNVPEAPNEQTARDRLIGTLRETFAAYGIKRRAVKSAEQERRFINAVLKEMGAKLVADPARRTRELARKNKKKTQATKRVPI